MISLNQNEKANNPECWEKAKERVDWWIRPCHLKLLCKSMSEMTGVDWAECLSTTNAVESHNRISCPDGGKNLRNVLEHVYMIDRAAF